MLRKHPCVLAFALIIGACSSPPEDPATQVDAIATEFVDAYYHEFPEEAYEVGYPDTPAGRYADHSPAAAAAWDARVDGWLAALDAIEPASLAGTPQAVTYAFAHERLAALVDRRVCRVELWNVSPTWTGWQFLFASTAAIQPVATAKDRRAALARASDTARYLKVETDNLRRGMEQGYLAPQSNVDKVVAQVTDLIDTPADESPLFVPATHTDNADFVAAYRKVYEDAVRPAMIAYRDFLANEYRGRDAIGVAANPDGAACYAASVRYWSSITMDAADIHRLGLSEMGRIRSQMLEIAETDFDTHDLKALMATLRSDPQYTFQSEQAVLDFVNAAVERARVAVHDWFGNVPDTKVVVIPSPAYEKDSGSGFYSAGAADGSRPATIQVGTYNPTAISKAGMESLIFHEGYPGHHLQGSVALTNQSLHPIQRFMYVSGMAEGWALYSERLADEMGLYSGPVTRVGMLSDQALRAARLVVDPGIHVLGWTRQDAIDYLLENTTQNADAAAAEIDRYAAVPGQATSYMLGSLEIFRLRKKAEAALGDRFEIREFHDRLLANGGVTLPMLEQTIDAWIAEQ
ncbi:MAG: DUF885 domain-containing protein [Woeseiaceae bacterium]